MTEDDQKRVPSASPPVAADPPPAHSITSMLLRLWQRVSLPVAKPETFQDKREIEDAVATRSPDVALDLLAEAREIYDAPIARAESVDPHRGGCCCRKSDRRRGQSLSRSGSNSRHMVEGSVEPSALTSRLGVRYVRLESRSSALEGA
jgi:hypothetical protein